MKDHVTEVHAQHLILPLANTDVDGRVSIDVLAGIADAHAHTLWGDDVAHGQPLPLVDAQGDTTAYVFPYIRGSQHFPDQDQLLGRWQALQAEVRTRNAANGSEADELEAELNRFGSQYGSIYVSARETNYPILKVAHFLHPFYQNGIQAQQQSRRSLGRDEVQIKHIYMLGPHEEYFEFATQDGSILLNVDSLEPEDKEQKLSVPASAMRGAAPELVADIRGIWAQIKESAPQGIDMASIATPSQIEKVIPHYSFIPVIDWTHWCLITAEAMVLGFYDNYTRSGTFLDFGRLIDYWYDHPSNGHNVPNFIDDLANPGPGPEGMGRMAKVARKNGYEFEDKWLNVNAQNDWGWNIVKGEIDAGRPVVWGIYAKDKNGNEVGHAMPVFGYRVTPYGKFYILYTTWGKTAEQQRQDWSYAYWPGLGPVTRMEIVTLRPIRGDGRGQLVLHSPDGGESLAKGISSTISWYQWGQRLRFITIDLSTDGGRTWSSIAKGVQTKEGWNQYGWTPQKTTAKARVRITGYDYKTECLAGDGSSDNFRVL